MNTSIRSMGVDHVCNCYALSGSNVGKGCVRFVSQLGSSPLFAPRCQVLRDLVPHFGARRQTLPESSVIDIRSKRQVWLAGRSPYSRHQNGTKHSRTLHIVSCQLKKSDILQYLNSNIQSFLPSIHHNYSTISWEFTAALKLALGRFKKEDNHLLLQPEEQTFIITFVIIYLSSHLQGSCTPSVYFLCKKTPKASFSNSDPVWKRDVVHMKHWFSCALKKCTDIGGVEKPLSWETILVSYIWSGPSATAVW